MKPSTSSVKFLASLSMLVCSGSLFAAGPPAAYQAVVIGVQPGYESSSAQAVNDSGEVCIREVHLQTIAHIALWKDGKWSEIPAPDGVQMQQCTAINHYGEVLGSRTPGKYAWFWSPRLGWYDLIPPYGYDLHPTGLNDRGEVVGNLIAWTDQFTPYPFRWYPGGQIETFRIDDDSMAEAYNVNRVGEISFEVHATGAPGVFEAGPHTISNCIGCIPGGLNDRGDMVLNQSDYRVYLWSKQQGLKLIPDMSFALGLDQAGYAFGTQQSTGGYAFWRDDSGMVPIEIKSEKNLGTTGIVSISPKDVASGWVVQGLQPGAPGLATLFVPVR
jgi:hypothetical protein